MEDTDLDNGLWGDLAQSALNTPSEGYKEQLFPVEFEGRRGIERFRDLVLRGYLPTFIYSLYLLVWGANFGLDGTPWLAFLLMLPVSAAVSWMVGPVFQFANLKRLTDVLPLFGLGLFLPLLLAIFDTAFRPTEHRMSFQAQAARSYENFSLPTTSLLLFLFSIAAAWGLKYWAQHVLTNAPWFDQEKASRERTISAALLLATPVLIYLFCVLAARPSDRVQAWKQQMRSAHQLSSPWYFEHSRDYQDVWRGLKRNDPQRALELLRKNQLPALSSHDFRYLLEDVVESAPESSQKTELALRSIPLALLRGQSVSRNDSFQHILSHLEKNELTVVELQMAYEQLGELSETLPNAEQYLNYLLYQRTQEKPQHWRVPLWITDQLRKHNLSPLQLSRTRWLQDCIETSLEVRESLGEMPLEEALAAPQSLSSHQKELMDKLQRETAPLAARNTKGRDLLPLPSEYRTWLQLALVATRLRLYQKSYGHFPPTLYQLGEKGLQKWTYRPVAGDGKAVIMAPGNLQLRLEP